MYILYILNFFDKNNGYSMKTIEYQVGPPLAGGNERENLNFTSAGRLHGCRVVGWLNDWIVGSKSMASASSSLARGPR
jgi:hypothetical protein